MLPFVSPLKHAMMELKQPNTATSYQDDFLDGLDDDDMLLDDDEVSPLKVSSTKNYDSAKPAAYHPSPSEPYDDFCFLTKE